LSFRPVSDDAPFVPRPLAAFGAEHEGHDKTDQGNENQQGDKHVVADAPDPVPQKRAPISAVDFSRHVVRVGSMVWLVIPRSD
jgi:hypothetical protein